MRAFVDQETCIGCGLCPSICPEIFFMDDAGEKAHAITDEVSADDEDSAQEARDNCPVDAIDLD
jgi:ferredoxin